jgi:GAF domain-containing protein
VTTEGSSETSFALHHAMVQTNNLVETLELIATVSCQAITGCETTGVTLKVNERPRTVAHHGDQALVLDDAQYADGVGPCLDAAHDDELVYVERIEDRRNEWPSFVRAAKELGIRSSLSMPLVVDGVSVGAMNLYASPENAFSTEVQDYALLFAREAALAAHNAAAYWEARTLVENLQLALESRDLIGQAKGVLAAVLRITPDAAFDLMRRASQRQNVKLRDLADHVVRTGELPAD